MEKTLVLKAEIREKTGSTTAAKVREGGRIPVTIYGHKRDAVSVSLDEHNFVKGLHHGSRVFDLEIDGKPEKVMIKELQYDHLGKKIIHADLVRVNVTEMVKVSVAIELKGKAKGAEHGGILETHADQLEVECVVTNIPEAIIVSVKEIDVGDTLHAEDVELPDGVKLISDPSTLLVTCSLMAAAIAAEDVEEFGEEEEAAGPEVIGEKKEAEEEGSSEEKK